VYQVGNNKGIMLSCLQNVSIYKPYEKESQRTIFSIWNNKLRSPVHITTHSLTQHVAVSHILLGDYIRPWMWAIIRPLCKNTTLYTETPHTFRQEISSFYITNTSKLYIKCIRVLSNYKRPEDIKKNSITVFQNF
jgi:hypothetical protein